MKSENVDHTLERILNTNFDRIGQKRWSHVALFKEYIRRVAMWAHKLGRSEDWLFFDIADEIDPQIRADDETIAILNGFVADKRWLGLMRDVYYWSLHWAALRDIESFDLPDPYEPLIVLYERGGFFRQHNTDVWAVSDAFGVSGIRLDDYRKLPPVVELDRATLDLLDTDEEKI